MNNDRIKRQISRFKKELYLRGKQRRFEEAIGEECFRRLNDLRVFYILRPGSDPFTMFNLYVEIMRGLKYAS